MNTRSSKHPNNKTKSPNLQGRGTPSSGAKQTGRGRSTGQRGGRDRGRGRGRGRGRSSGRGRGKGISNSTIDNNQSTLTAFCTPNKSDSNTEGKFSTKRKSGKQKLKNSTLSRNSNTSTDTQVEKKRDTRNSPECPKMNKLIDEVNDAKENLDQLTTPDDDVKKSNDENTNSPTQLTHKDTYDSPGGDKDLMKEEKSQSEDDDEEEIYSDGTDEDDIIIGGEANETDEEIGATELVDSEEEDSPVTNFKRLIKSPTPSKQVNKTINGIPVTVLQDAKQIQLKNANCKVQKKLFEEIITLPEGSNNQIESEEFPLDYNSNDHIVEYQEELETNENKNNSNENEIRTNITTSTKTTTTELTLQQQCDIDNKCNTHDSIIQEKDPETSTNKHKNYSRNNEILEIVDSTAKPADKSQKSTQGDTDNVSSTRPAESKDKDTEANSPNLIVEQPKLKSDTGNKCSTHNKEKSNKKGTNNTPLKKTAIQNKKKKKKNNKKQSKVDFLVHQHQQKHQGETQDDENTITSDKTSHYMKKNEADKHVPPDYIRYRLGVQLEKVDLKTLLSSKKEATAVNPLVRYQDALKQLFAFIFSFDRDAKFISWKCSDKYTSISANPDTFPTDLEKIATYFNGYRSNLNEAYKNYFRFCLHTPNWDNLWTETKLMEWSDLHSYTFSKCIIQSENARSIGWLLYSLSFTNLEAITSHMTAKTDFEWGLKITAPANDTKKAWKDRLKAYEVFVPLTKVATAKTLISNTFASHQGVKPRLVFEDCYIFVGNQRKQKKDKLSKFHSQMVGRQSFRQNNINTFFITCIVNDVDIRITTRNKEEWTLREMILNLKAKNTEFGDDRLFLSMDFSNDSGKVWFNSVRGEGGPGYFLSTFTWNAEQAELVSEGLGAYLGRLYGKTGLHKYISEDHWQTVSQWSWNKKDQEFDPPELKTTANNILHDPNAKVMQRWYDKQQQLAEEQKEKEHNKSIKINDSFNQNEEKEELNVQSLQNRDNEVLVQEETIVKENFDKFIEESQSIRDIAKSIHSGYISISSSSAVSTPSKLSTFTDLKKHRAYEIMKGEQFEDMDSVTDPNTNEARIKTVIQNQDQQSVSSSITGITDNTGNRTGAEVDTYSDASQKTLPSSASLQSFKESELDKLIDGNQMTIEELERTVHAATAQWRLRASQKAARYIAIAKEKAQQKTDENNKLSKPETDLENTSPVKGKQKIDQDEDFLSHNSNQSNSNCDAVSQQ